MAMIEDIKKALLRVGKPGTYKHGKLIPLENAQEWLIALVEYYEANESPYKPDLYLRIRAARKRLQE